MRNHFTQMSLLAWGLAAALGAVSCTRTAQVQDDKDASANALHMAVHPSTGTPTTAPAVQPLAPASTQPSATTITPHLDAAIEPGRSLVWCASMQLAWDALGDWAGGPVQLWGNPPAAVSMG